MEEGTDDVIVCVLAHGLGGDVHDWDVWVEVLRNRFPAWVLCPLRTLVLDHATEFMGATLDQSAHLAATEILVALRTHLLRGVSRVILHCIGHSMGGLAIRGALPRIVSELPREELLRVRFGHYLSLSTPHLGVQPGRGAPHLWWKNLAKLTKGFDKPQPAQFLLQDGCEGQLPYIMSLADKEGAHISILRAFATRTCVTMTNGDALVPLCSGLIIQYNPFKTPWVAGLSNTWRFEQRVGTVNTGSFETYLTTGKLKSKCCIGDFVAPESKAAISSELLDNNQSLDDFLLGVKGTESNRKPLGEDISVADCSQAQIEGEKAVLPLVHSTNSEQTAVASDSPVLLKEIDAQQPLTSEADSPDTEDPLRIDCRGSFEVSMPKPLEAPMVCTLSDEVEECQARLRKPSSTRYQNSDDLASLSWLTSSDGACRFPREALEGLNSMDWQRIPTTALMVGMNLHVFLVAKKSEQHKAEHEASRECIKHLAEIFAD